MAQVIQVQKDDGDNQKLMAVGQMAISSYMNKGGNKGIKSMPSGTNTDASGYDSNDSWSKSTAGRRMNQNSSTGLA